MRDFRRRIKTALGDPILQEALSASAKRRIAGRFKAFESLPQADQVRAEARAIRQTSIQQLEALHKQFASQLKVNGVFVHHAKDTTQAQELILEIASSHQASLIAKSKSMVSEEIKMNAALEAHGFRVVETDLGEYIVQLRNEPPSHIVTPALHLKRAQVAETFRDQLGMDYSTDVSDLNRAAQSNLRDVFIDADIGVSGVNFGIAESGTLCIIANEGNGRMVTTLPRVHIALMGIERIIPRLDDLAPMLQLLPRSATGQVLSSYVTLLHGPRKSGELDGSEERHVILIDNHRSSLLRSPLEEALLCIRCGACLNACPVFQCLGGHAYASPYPGPIGSILSPGLWGLETYGHLAKASTLCGICREVCPVDIDLPGLLLEVRDQNHRQKSAPSAKGIMIRLFTWLMTSSKRYAVAQFLAAAVSRLLPKHHGWIRRSPAPLNAWTKTRDLPPFRSPRMSTTHSITEILPSTPGHRLTRPTTKPPIEKQPGVDQPVMHWINQCRKVDGEVSICQEGDLAQHIVEVIHEHGTNAVLLSPELREEYPALIADLRDAQIELINPVLPKNEDVEARKTLIRMFDEIPIGITSVSAALAETGSIALNSRGIRSNFASLLPSLHIAILREENIYEDFSTWVDKQPNEVVDGTTVIITGPSRTADIEMTLTIGVHGPARLMVFLVTEDTKYLTR